MSRMADILTRLTGTMFSEVLGAIPEESYTHGTVRVIGSMLLLAAREYEEGADMRVWENQQIRQLLGDGAPLMNDENMSRRFVETSREIDESLVISALDQTNDKLKRMLIDLHSAVENRDDEASQKMNKAIWIFLRVAADKHRIDFY